MVDPVPSPEHQPHQFRLWIRSQFDWITHFHHRRQDRKIEEIELRVLGRRAPNAESSSSEKDESRGVLVERMSEVERSVSDIVKRVTDIEKYFIEKTIR